MKETLKTLCALPGVSSFEEEVREEIKRRAEPHASWMKVDKMGNLMVHKKGEKPAPARLMLLAHMDEVGLIVKQITEEGYLKFGFIGGIDRRVVLGKRVYVGPKKVPGVIGLKAYHLVGKEEETRVPKVEDLYIDIGAKDRREAEALVSLGDAGVFHSRQVEFGHGLFQSKAIDDRVGCAVLLKLLEEPLPVDTTFVFTVQEEVGTRGAFGAAFAEAPEIALVVEGTTAADLPGVPAHRQVCRVGGGVVIPFMDGGTIYDPGLYEMLVRLAKERGLPWQTKQYLSGGTDARAVQRSRAGVRVAGLAVAVRYIHSPASVMSLDDGEGLLALSRAFLQEMGKEPFDV